nr:heavy metal-associated isoprenylated plant protein 3-like [Lolium perenne]
MEVDKGSMTVVGRFDAKKLRDRVARKTRKKVDLVGSNNSNTNKGGGGDKKEKGNDGEGKPEKKDEEGKELDKDSVHAAVLHARQVLDRIPYMNAGVEQVRMDFPKNQVTVIGTMDAKCLPEKLRERLKRPVDVVAPGKDKDKDGKQQGEGGNKDKEGGKQQGDCKDGKQSKEAAEKAMAAELALWKTDYYDSQPLQATQFLLSDENPNACAVM